MIAEGITLLFNDRTISLEASKVTWMLLACWNLVICFGFFQRREDNETEVNFTIARKMYNW